MRSSSARGPNLVFVCGGGVPGGGACVLCSRSCSDAGSDATKSNAIGINENQLKCAEDWLQFCFDVRKNYIICLQDKTEIASAQAALQNISAV